MLPARLFIFREYLLAALAAEQGRAVLFVPVALAAGIALYMALPEEPPAWAACAVLLAAVVLARRTRHSLVWRVPAAGLLCLVAGLALALAAARLAAPWRPVPRTAVEVAGQVTAAEALPEAARVTLAGASLDGTPFGRAVRIRLRADTPPPLPGDRIRLRALLRPPPPPAYPGAWDMRRQAFFDGMGAYGTALGPVLAEAGRAGGLAAWLGRVRAAVAETCLADLPGPEGAIAAALLTGRTAAIAKPDRAAFAASGLSHLLAVAGLHIGIVMGCCWALARLSLGLSRRALVHLPVPRLAALAALAGGLGYLLLAGGHVPLRRAFAMAALATLATLTDRRAVSLRSLALAATVLIAIDPAAVMGVGFQMSFAAVLALIATWEGLRPRLHLIGAGTWWRAPALYVLGGAGTSLIAGTASLPFAAYHFGTAALYYVPANLVAVPLTAFWVLPLGLAALALMPFGAAGLALAPMGWGISVILAAARAVAAWPGATLHVPAAPPWGLALVVLGAALLGLLRTRLRWLGGIPLAAGLASPLLARAPDAIVGPDARLIAVRQGSEVLVLANRPDPFEAEAPLRVWGALPARALAPDAADIPLPQGTIRIVRARPARCAGAAVLLSPEPLRGDCPDIPVVDRFTVWRQGAAAILLGPDGARILTTAARAGHRPWTDLPRPEAAKLPPAATE